MHTKANSIFQMLSVTVPNHAVILSLLADLGEPRALDHGQKHVAYLLSAMGDAARMVQGEYIPEQRVLHNLQAMAREGAAMKQVLGATPPNRRDLVQRILEAGAQTTKVEEQLLSHLGNFSG